MKRGEVWTWSDEGGRLDFLQITDTLSWMRVTGRISDDAALVLEEKLPGLLTHDGTEHYWDLFELDSFSNKFRHASIEITTQRRKRYERVHVLSGSVLIRMAVAAAGLPAGGMLKSYSDSSRFEEQLRDSCRTRGVDMPSLPPR
ncbi:hypothetical protein G6O69_33135 [Pseudenhygromyxa sp. WMMC2535]|uniref:hypothetical protein n=1 Tax=Pseudenhygromyxa sp. WMMC2535 TaxID=2712867 RepID=UPI001554DF62|nr:hypothetical protein [Pseudenhygromyxa sp. WMMC2535]NVB42713.1 hypothetical protein [Pseudenhygromyxa sp. WMMC2535]